MDYVYIMTTSGRVILAKADMALLLAGRPTPLSCPLVLNVAMGQHGPALQISPYVMGEQPNTKSEPTLMPHSVESYCEMPEAFKSQYIKETTGIVTPQRGGLSIVQ